jgi:hypothetical protein
MLHLTMNGPTPNSRQIYAMFGRDERTLKLMRQPRVHLTYQTAFVDDAGKLELRDDLYGMDARIHAILHSDERKIADVPPPQDPSAISPPPRAIRKSCAGSSGARRSIRSISSNSCSATVKAGKTGIPRWPDPGARPSAF